MDVNYMDIKKFRELGFLQEVNRQFLHPLGLALEVTVVDAESDDARLIDRIAPLLADHPRLIAFVKDEPSRTALAGELACAIVADFWPPGSEHISGVWDYRLDEEGIVFAPGMCTAEREALVAAERAKHEAKRREMFDGKTIQPT